MTDFAELLDQAGRADYGPAVQARYSGTCASCGGRWEPGDSIAYSIDEAGWVHARHADDRD